MKKTLLGILVILTVISVTLSAARRPEKTQILSSTKNTMVLRKGDYLHKLTRKPLSKSSAKTTIIDTIALYNAPESADGYDDFLGGYLASGDTVMQRMKLLTPGKITKFMMQNMNAGTATCYLWNPAVEWDADGSGFYRWPGDAVVQQLFPFGLPMVCEATDPANQYTGYDWTPTWNTLDIENTIGQGVELHEDSLWFWIGYTLDAGNGPQIFQDDDYSNSDADGHCGSFATIAAVGDGWYSITSTANNDNYKSHMIQVEVQYDSMPPVISDVSTLCNTFSTSKTVEAQIIDLDGDEIEAQLRVKIGENGTYETVPMTNTDGDWFEGEASGSAGDTVYYYVRAYDNSLGNASNTKNFVIVEAPENTPLLVVDDGGYTNDSLYTVALNNIGQDFILWDLEDNNGIDNSVLHYDGFRTVMIFGWSTTITPCVAGDEDPYDIKGLLDNGNNFVLIDQDYLYTNGLTGTGNLASGDFAYDYLGIDSYNSDPTSDGGATCDADIGMYGVRNNEITNDFSSPTHYGLIDYEMMGWSNWADYINPVSGATTIFTGKDNSESMAISYEGSGFKTVTFAFPIEMSQDMAQFETLMTATMTWLGTNVSAIEEGSELVANEFTLEQNYPNPFNPTTNIRYSIPADKHVKLTVYNVLGQQVKTLVNSKQGNGVYNVKWNGKDMNGVTVPAGLYLYKLEAGNLTQMNKMLFVK